MALSSKLGSSSLPEGCGQSPGGQGALASTPPAQHRGLHPRVLSQGQVAWLKCWHLQGGLPDPHSKSVCLFLCPGQLSLHVPGPGSWAPHVQCPLEERGCVASQGPPGHAPPGSGRWLPAAGSAPWPSGSGSCWSAPPAVTSRRSQPPPPTPCPRRLWRTEDTAEGRLCWSCLAPNAVYTPAGRMHRGPGHGNVAPSHSWGLQTDQGHVCGLAGQGNCKSFRIN